MLIDAFHLFSTIACGNNPDSDYVSHQKRWLAKHFSDNINKTPTDK